MVSRLLPHDIIVEILTRLPVKSLLRFRCVSKSWCELFRNPSFVKMHHKRACENDENISVMFKDSCSPGNISSISLGDREEVVLGFDDVREEVVLGFDDREVVRFDFVGSYNGLLCIRILIGGNYKEIFRIWNPSTKEFKELPALIRKIPKEIPEGYDYSGPEIYGFGYDCSIEDYKVVKGVSYFDKGDYKYNCTEVLVYILGSDSWRRIGDMPYLPYHDGPVTHVNGALHWVVNHDHKVHNSSLSGKLIISLDLVNEGYLEVPQPDYLDKGGYLEVPQPDYLDKGGYLEVPQPDYLDKGFDVYTCELEGCLCVVCKFDNLRLDGWMMKDYGVKGSWSKIFSISQPLGTYIFHTCIPIKIFKNGEILVKNGGFVAFDPKNNAVRELVIDSCKIYDAIVHVGGSLNSLNSGTYVGTSGVIRRGRLKSAQEAEVLA